jgi:hypothetical protein
VLLATRPVHHPDRLENFLDSNLVDRNTAGVGATLYILYFGGTGAAALGILIHPLIILK